MSVCANVFAQVCACVHLCIVCAVHVHVSLSICVSLGVGSLRDMVSEVTSS